LRWHKPAAVLLAVAVRLAVVPLEAAPPRVALEPAQEPAEAPPRAAPRARQRVVRRRQVLASEAIYEEGGVSAGFSDPTTWRRW